MAAGAGTRLICAGTTTGKSPQLLASAVLGTLAPALRHALMALSSSYCGNVGLRVCKAGRVCCASSDETGVFRDSHELHGNPTLPTETEACASVTSAFLQVIQPARNTGSKQMTLVVSPAP